ncbi:MAG: hypothetical protein JOZ45_15890 [Acidobacteriaceae bacterium]|nr:hypothetical protein [Acidobacteriaceae bacterium]
MADGRWRRMWRQRDRLTTLISHASRPMLSVAPLTALVSLTSFFAPLISSVGITSLLTPDMIATSGTAVALAAVATNADRENCAAFGGSANPQANDDVVLD